MSFISVAVEVFGAGLAAEIAAGAMLGGSVTIGSNVIRGRNPFDNIGQGILMGGLTAGITPYVQSGVGEFVTGGISNAAATGLTAGALGYARTGNINDALTSGLSAYGLSSLGGNLENAGGESLANQDTILNAERMGAEAGNAASDLNIPEAMRGDIVDTAANAVPRTTVKELTEQLERDGFTPEEIRAKFAAEGKSAVASNPMSFLKANAKNLMFATSPLLADKAVQNNMPRTATKPGTIRPYSYDPYSGTYTAYDPYEATPTKAADGGLMGYGESSNAPITRRNIDNMQNTDGMFNYAQDGGGVMRMAGGGLAALAFADGGGVDMTSPFMNLLQHPETIPLQYGETQDQGLARVQSQQDELNLRVQNRMAMDGQQPQTVNWTQSPAGLNPSSPTVQTQADVDYWTKRNADAQGSPFTAGGGGGGGGGGQDQVAYIKSLMANNPAPVGPTNAQMMAAQDQERAELAARRAAVSTGGNDFSITGPNSPQLVTPAPVIPRPNVPAVSGPPIDRASATGIQTLAKPDVPRPTAQTDGPPITRSGIEQLVHGSIYDPTTGHFRNPTAAELGAKAIADAKGNTAEMTQLTNQYFDSYKAGEVLDFAGGTLTKNADGTATHKYTDANGKQQTYTFSRGTDIATIANSDPNIANEWKGMFNYTPPKNTGSPIISTPGPTGPVLTPGTGSAGHVVQTPTGWTPPIAPPTRVPTSIEDFNSKYNTQTGGSKQAYDYLTGKSEYSATPYTKTGEIMKPYAESVLGIPGDDTKKKYLFKDGKYTLNPGFIPAKPYTKPAEGKEWSWNATKKKWMQVDASSNGSPSEDNPSTESPGQNNNNTGYDDSSRGANGGLMAVPAPAGIANGGLAALTMARGGSTRPPFFSKTTGKFNLRSPQVYAGGGAASQYNLGGYSDGGRLLRGPGDGVSDSIPATIGNRQPAKLADGEFVVPARIVSELGNGSTEAGARKLYAMMDRVQQARRQSVGKGKVAKNSRADKYLPA